MMDPSSVRLVGPLQVYRDGVWAELLARGYSPLTGGNLLRLMAHLSRWLDERGLEPGQLLSEQISEFLRHRRALGYTSALSPRSLEPVLHHLRRIGVVPPPPPPVPDISPLGVLLRDYEEYLVKERGLVPESIRFRRRVARKFLSALPAEGTLDLESLGAAELTSFVLAEARTSSVGNAKLTVCALRSLMRYLHVCGRVSSHLAEAIPPIAGCRLSHIPRALRPEEMRRLLKSCDRRTGIGRRNFAVMILMTRLGLRRAEVAALRLDDIRWSSGELLVRGKANREDRLPLPQDVGDAIVAYIKRGRPRTPSRQLFLQHRAPRKALSPADVTGIVQRAGRRIGLQVAPHRLRHTAATQMLRSGASLPEIAHLLRHRALDTTAIYAKVDDRRLRAVARRWPGVQP